jgi:hypothetical protein
MSLITNIQSGFTRVATEFKSLRGTLGVNANLTTSVKSTLVGAINEVNAKPSGGGGGAPIADGTVATTSTYSSSKIVTLVQEGGAQVKADILGGTLATDLDSLLEVIALVNKNDGEGDSATAANTTALGVRLRFDAAQSLTAGQKTQGQANLGVYGTADIGDPTTNFVTAFEAALA